MAPKSGKETRKDIADGSKKVAKKAKQPAKKLLGRKKEGKGEGRSLKRR